MEPNEFPFPNKENSRKCLKQDYVYNKIDKDKVEQIFQAAWHLGETYGKEFSNILYNKRDMNMRKVFKSTGIKIEESDIDYVIKDRRYFCEYYPKIKKIKVYSKSVELWSLANDMGYEDGLDIILSHEYFHHIEHENKKAASQLYTVPIIQIGELKLGRTGILSLSEIAANAFSEVYYSNKIAMHDISFEEEKYVSIR